MLGEDVGVASLGHLASQALLKRLALVSTVAVLVRGQLVEPLPHLVQTFLPFFGVAEVVVERAARPCLRRRIVGLVDWPGLGSHENARRRTEHVVLALDHHHPIEGQTAPQQVVHAAVRFDVHRSQDVVLQQRTVCHGQPLQHQAPGLCVEGQARQVNGGPITGGETVPCGRGQKRPGQQVGDEEEESDQDRDHHRARLAHGVPVAVGEQLTVGLLAVALAHDQPEQETHGAFGVQLLVTLAALFEAGELLPEARDHHDHDDACDQPDGCRHHDAPGDCVVLQVEQGQEGCVVGPGHGCLCRALQQPTAHTKGHRHQRQGEHLGPRSHRQGHAQVRVEDDEQENPGDHQAGVVEAPWHEADQATHHAGHHHLDRSCRPPQDLCQLSEQEHVDLPSADRVEMGLTARHRACGSVRVHCTPWEAPLPVAATRRRRACLVLPAKDHQHWRPSHPIDYCGQPDPSMILPCTRP